MKKLVVVGIVVACIWLMYRYPHTMLSPGELVGAHQKLSNECIACHKPFWGIANDKCISCHKISEIGKDTLHPNDTSKVLFHENLSNQECSSCHTDHKGIIPDKSLSGFNHEMLSGTLAGNCNSCHQQPSDKIHQQISASCNSCHNTNGWKSSATFNHEMIQGADKNNCASCHQKPNDSYHISFNDNCDKCHSTAKWVPSSFEHSKYFVLDKNHNATCNTCHANNNFSSYTCYGCHEHSENEIINKHNEEGISNFSNCVSCHRSGNEHEREGGEHSGREVNQNDVNGVKDYMNSGENDDKKGHEGDDGKDDD